MTKTIKFCFLASFILCAIFLIGCSSTSNQNTFTTLSDSMSKITETLDKIQEIKTSELIINDFMDENNLARISIQNTTENSSMTSFIAKLASLNNKIINTVDINNALKQSKKVIKAKALHIKSLCEQNLSNEIKIIDSKLDNLQELNKIVMSNNTRINMSRNEVDNVLQNIKNIKKTYNTQTLELNTIYSKLETSLNSRLSYYSNIISGLDEMSYILCECYPEVDFDNKYANDVQQSFIENCEDCQNNNNSSASNDITDTENIVNDTQNEISDNDCPECNQSQINVDKTNQEECKECSTQKKSLFKKNIDTFENAGTTPFGDYRNNPAYHQNNFGYGYGNNYGNYGYNGYGMGYNGLNGFGMNGYGIGGYGFGRMPFGYGYGPGIAYPNINTFWTYKNIDTYKSRKTYNKEQNQAVKDENIQDYQDEYFVANEFKDKST